MANFAPAYDKTSNYEGGWVKDTADRGGETYCGISRHFWPDWKGWEIIDAQPNKWRGKRFPIEELEHLITAFYKKEFWDKMGGGDIESQPVANFIYDWFVNSGADAIRQTQRVVGVESDGIVGAKTRRAINEMPPDLLMLRLIAARLLFLANIIYNSPNQRKFLKGWKTRILSYANSF